MALDKQLDDLDEALDQLERRSDHLQEETKQLLMEARASRGGDGISNGGSVGVGGGGDGDEHVTASSPLAEEGQEENGPPSQGGEEPSKSSPGT